VFELCMTFLLGTLAAVVAVNLGSGGALMLLVGIAHLWQAGQVVLIVMEARNVSRGSTG